MTLEEAARCAPRACTAPVPPWAWGCYARGSIAYASGHEDDGARVLRVQAQSLAGEICVPGWRPDVSGRASLHDCTVQELLDLSAVEGGIAEAAWCDGAMTWENPAHFQPYDKWPEPGLLQRVGPRLIETAPSGAYVEDWRLRPGSSGLLVGLRLMFETGLDGLTRPRDGGLVIAGEHCIFALDRRRPLPSDAPVPLQMRQAGDPYAFADMAFDAQVSYGRRQPDGSWRAELSTNPFHEGAALPVADGFSRTSILEVLRQQVGEGEARIVRQWRIDTLIPDAAITAATACEDAGAAWLKREGKTLLRGL